MNLNLSFSDVDIVQDAIIDADGMVYVALNLPGNGFHTLAVHFTNWRKSNYDCHILKFNSSGEFLQCTVLVNGGGQTTTITIVPVLLSMKIMYEQ